MLIYIIDVHFEFLPLRSTISLSRSSFNSQSTILGMKKLMTWKNADTGITIGRKISKILEDHKAGEKERERVEQLPPPRKKQQKERESCTSHNVPPHFPSSAELIVEEICRRTAANRRLIEGNQLDLDEKVEDKDWWKVLFRVGTEWGPPDALNELNWDFTNLKEALEQGGRLYGKKVYVFGFTESHLIPCENDNKDVLVPAVVCIESSIPPSDKIEAAKFQGETGVIIPMRAMKMDWIPYIPLDKRPVDRLKSQIYVLGCTQRRAAFKHPKEDLFNKYNYCLPYIDNPFKEDETEQSTVVQISFPSEQPVVCEYDWARNNLEKFTDDLIKNLKDEFMSRVQEQIDKAKEEAKEALEKAKEAREKAKEGMSEETKTAYKEMKLYKFYPLPSPQTPDVAKITKSSFINRDFGQAHEVL